MLMFELEVIPKAYVLIRAYSHSLCSLCVCLSSPSLLSPLLSSSLPTSFPSLVIPLLSFPPPHTLSANTSSFPANFMSRAVWGNQFPVGQIWIIPRGVYSHVMRTCGNRPLKKPDSGLPTANIFQVSTIELQAQAGPRCSVQSGKNCLCWRQWGCEWKSAFQWKVTLDLHDVFLDTVSAFKISCRRGLSRSGWVGSPRLLHLTSLPLPTC